MIRVWKNMLAPINKIPPKILALIPDFWNMHKRDHADPHMLGLEGAIRIAVFFVD